MTKKKPSEKVPAKAPPPVRTVEDARDEVLIRLLDELRMRAPELRPMELAGGIRTLLQERTAERSVVEQDEDPGLHPTARAGEEVGKKAARRAKKD
jgi:hypothetical protein